MCDNYIEDPKIKINDILVKLINNTVIIPHIESV
jgi:hypothetical protein